jgi:pantoate--beta-alanine ligase
MLIARTRPELDAIGAGLRRDRGGVALVPTMGALHAGHLALVEAAVAAGLGVVTSIFVNPLQFGANEDLARYPRDEAGDLAVLAEAGCHAAWVPDVRVMYPPGEATTIDVAGPALDWEGAARPGHFRGVATVVAKLFRQARCDTAYFGEKDWQQLQVVRRMAADLELGVDVIGIPTVRDRDGLALSSRNRFLSPAERATAALLPSVLRRTAGALAGGGDAAPVLAAPVLAEAVDELAASGFGVDYLALVDGPSLTPLPAARPGARLIAAARLGSVRLLDNLAAG